MTMNLSFRGPSEAALDMSMTFRMSSCFTETNTIQHIVSLNWSCLINGIMTKEFFFEGGLKGVASPFSGKTLKKKQCLFKHPLQPIWEKIKSSLKKDVDGKFDFFAQKALIQLISFGKGATGNDLELKQTYHFSEFKMRRCFRFVLFCAHNFQRSIQGLLLLNIGNLDKLGQKEWKWRLSAKGHWAYTYLVKTNPTEPRQSVSN